MLIYELLTQMFLLNNFQALHGNEYQNARRERMPTISERKILVR